MEWQPAVIKEKPHFCEMRHRQTLPDSAAGVKVRVREIENAFKNWFPGCYVEIHQEDAGRPDDLIGRPRRVAKHGFCICRNTLLTD